MINTIHAFSKIIISYASNIYYAWINCALWIMASCGCAKGVTVLIKCGADVHFENDVAFLMGVSGNNPKTVSKLLEFGAVIDSDWVIWCAARKQLELVSILLKHGADVHCRNDCALKESIVRKDSKMVALLLTYGANMYSNMYYWKNKSLFYELHTNFDEEMADVILQHYDINDDNCVYFPHWYLKQKFNPMKSAAKV